MKYILTIALLFNVAFGQSLFGVVAGDGFDIDARRYLDSAGVTSSTERTATNKFFKRLKAGGYWGAFRTICPMLGTGESNRRLNAKDIRRNTDSSVRLTFSGTYNFDSSYTGVALRGGRAWFNTTTGNNSFNSTEGGLSPNEADAIHVISVRQTTGFSSYDFIRTNDANQTTMGVRANTTTVGYFPCNFCGWYDFTGNYYGITILNGNSNTNEQVLMQSGTVLQTTYRQDGTGVVYYPFGMSSNTTLNVNLIMSGNGQFTQSQLTTLNTIVTDFLTEIGRL